MRIGPKQLQLLRIGIKRASVAVLGLCLAGTATAQVAGSIGLDSDYRLRGYSLTNDRPAALLQVTYDNSSGLYLSLSGLTEVGSDTRFLGLIGSAGYA